MLVHAILYVLASYEIFFAIWNAGRNPMDNALVEFEAKSARDGAWLVIKFSSHFIQTFLVTQTMYQNNCSVTFFYIIGAFVCLASHFICKRKWGIMLGLLFISLLIAGFWRLIYLEINLVSLYSFTFYHLPNFGT